MTDAAVPSSKRRALTRPFAFVAAFAIALSLWFALSWSVALDEWIVGVPVAFLASALSARALPTLAPQGPLPRNVVRIVARLPVDVVRDTVRVIGALASSIVRGTELDGAFVEADAGALDATKRAWLAASMSVAPNTIVVSVDAKTGRVVAHQLHPTARVQRDVDRALGRGAS